MKQLLKLTGCLAVAGLFASCQSAQQEADYQIIPMPQEIVTASGNPFILKSSVKILYPEGNENRFTFSGQKIEKVVTKTGTL